MIEILNWFAETWFRTIAGFVCLGVILVVLDVWVTNIINAYIRRGK